MNKKSFHFCFTLNNYDQEEYSRILTCAEESARYWIIGKEVGASGTPHLQGYISLRRRGDCRYVRNLLGPRIHLEVARGTARQNREYCSKGGDFTEGGTIPKGAGSSQPNRDELATEFVESFGRGNSGLAEFSANRPGTWYYSGHNLLRNAFSLCRPVQRPDIDCVWIYGLPGVGKSRTAHGVMPEAYIKDPRTKWWNGYMMEKEVIIDDFGPGGIDINHLLRWFDRYKCMVETKGGMVPLMATKFIVTSNFTPTECFVDKEGVPHPQIEALNRRIHRMYIGGEVEDQPESELAQKCHMFEI